MKARSITWLAVGASVVSILWFLSRPPGTPRLSVSLHEHSHGPGGVPCTVFLVTNPSPATIDYAVLPYEFRRAGGWQTQVVTYPYLTQTGSLKPGETTHVVIDSPPTNSAWRMAITYRPRLPVVSQLFERLHRWPRRPFHEEKIVGPEIHSDHSSGQQGAPPNGGPATQLGNSGATEGPPSVS